MVESRKAKRIVCLIFSSSLPLVGGILLFVAAAGGQENYPVPPGDPEDWGIPGRATGILMEPSSPSESTDLLAAPRQQENATRNDPDVPWGEADEEYTGTKQFGGMAGTGITKYGTTSR